MIPPPDRPVPRRPTLRTAAALVSLLGSLGSCLLIAPAGDELASEGPPCPAGTKSCEGACVALDDPATGCALPACAPCMLPHAATTCREGACAVDRCEAGWADCDGVGASGCEIELPAGVTGCGCHAIRFVDEFGALVVDTSSVGPIELGSQDFTMEAWVNTPAEAPRLESNGLFTTVSRGQPDEPLALPFFTMHVSPTDLSCEAYDGGVNLERNLLLAEGVLQPNRWTHVACVRRGDRLVGFVDGLEVGRVPYDVEGVQLDRPLVGGDHGRSLPDLRLGPTRFSKIARYQGDFAPTTHWMVDDDTLLQFLVFAPYEQLTHVLGRMQDESERGLSAVSQGGVVSSAETPCDG